EHVVHQPDAQRLRRAIAAAEEHDLPGTRMAHGLDEPLVALHVVREAELCRRNGELGRGAAIAQVAGKGDLEAAAHAEAVDHGEGGLARALDRVEYLVEQAVVRRHGGAFGAVALELGDVRAGSEGLLAGAAEHDAAYRRIGVESLHGGTHGAPHRTADGIAPRDVVENDPADRALALDDHAPFAHALPPGPPPPGP